MLPNSPKLFQSMTISWGNLLVQAFGFLRSPHRFACVADALNLLYRDYINGLNECVDQLQRRLPSHRFDPSIYITYFAYFIIVFLFNLNCIVFKIKISCIVIMVL